MVVDHTRPHGESGVESRPASGTITRYAGTVGLFSREVEFTQIFLLTTNLDNANVRAHGERKLARSPKGWGVVFDLLLELYPWELDAVLVVLS